MRVVGGRLPSDVMPVVDGEEGVLRAVGLELHAELEFDVVGGRHSALVVDVVAASVGSTVWLASVTNLIGASTSACSSKEPPQRARTTFSG